VAASEGKGVTATELHHTDTNGVDVRTIQRDLQVMGRAGMLKMKSHGKQDAPQWFLHDASPIEMFFADDPRQSATQELSASQLKSSRVALSVVTLYEHARHLLHHAALTDLIPIYLRAKDILSKSHSLEHRWVGKVVHGSQHVQLRQAKVSSGVLHALQTALLEGTQASVKYRSRKSKATRAMDLHPLALAYQDSSIYLVCKLDGDDIIRKLPLHRFDAVQVLESRQVSVPEDFVASEHVQKVHIESGPIRLKMRINEALRERLDESETPLTEDQLLTPLGNGDWLMECDYEYTRGLEWWILGHGAAVEVLEPARLRENIRKCVAEMARIYGCQG
jgi:predicted DNA-binding transcriptional regulator YafY